MSLKRFFKVTGVNTSTTKRQAVEDEDGKPSAGPAPEGNSGRSYPLKFVSWNVNGLIPRLKNSEDQRGLLDLIKRESPDIIALQEVRLPARKEGSRCNRARMHMGDNKDTRADFALVESTIMKWDYSVLLSLADRRYAGVALLVKRCLQPHVKAVRFNLPGASETHHPEGRFILIEFERFGVLVTYVPNHGWAEASFQRRGEWDAAMLSFLRDRPKPLVWLGDCNVSHTDLDVSHPAYFRNAKSDKDLLPTDPDYRGQPGFAPIEQRRFGEMLRVGGLVDAYRHTHPQGGPNDFTWRGNRSETTWGKYYGKGMRIDYSLVSSSLLEGDGAMRIRRAEVLGRGIEREGFLGSDHCPILLELAEDAETGT